MGEKYKPVVFEDSQGNEISNDPVWHAQKTLRDAGLAVDEPEPVKTPKARKVVAPAVIESTDDDDELSDDETDEDIEDSEETEDEEPYAYENLDGKALKAIAKERGVDTTGFTKASQIRTALIAADAAE